MRTVAAMVLACLGVLAGGCGAETAPTRAPAAPAALAGTEAPPAVEERAGGVEVAPVRAPRKRSRPALPEGRTVPGALRRALLTKRIDRDTWSAYRRTDSRARAALAKVTGRRRAELATVVATLDGMAAAKALTSDRLAAAFGTLERNVDAALGEPLPDPAERRIGRDGIVWQAYGGHGLQLHPLASFGRANALALPCLRERRVLLNAARRDARRMMLVRRTGATPKPRRPRLTGPRCRRKALTRLLDRLVESSSRYRGYRAWEHQFAYGGGRPLWVSGMTQATAAQALARGGVALDRPDYVRAAHEALGAFEQPPPLGVRVQSPAGNHYLMYSFAPGLKVLNGQMQAVSGLHDVAELTGSRKARRLSAAGERVTRTALREADTGAWTLYSAGGREARLNYHKLVRDLAGRLCGRTEKRIYCDARRRFARYLEEPPGLELRSPERARAGRPAPIVVRLDRVSTVSLRVSGRGKTVSRRMELPRGRHVLDWAPERRGRYRVRVSAESLSGRRAQTSAEVQVAPKVDPKPKAKPKKRPAARKDERKPPKDDERERKAPKDDAREERQPEPDDKPKPRDEPDGPEPTPAPTPAPALELDPAPGVQE